MKSFRETVLDLGKMFEQRKLDPAKFGFDQKELLSRESEFEPIGNGWKSKLTDIKPEDAVDVGDGSLILVGVKIGRASAINSGCFVGAFTELPHHSSVLCNNAILGHETKFAGVCYVAPDSAIGSHVSFNGSADIGHGVNIGSNSQFFGEAKVGDGKEIPENSLVGNIAKHKFVGLDDRGEVVLLQDSRVIQHPRGRLDFPRVIGSGMGETAEVRAGTPVATTDRWLD